MTINGEEFKFDITDVNDSKRYTEALNKYKEAIKGIKDTDGIETIQKGLDALRDFVYDATGHDCLYGITSLGQAMTEVRSFFSQIREQKARLDKLMFDIKAEAEEVAADESPRTAIYPDDYRGMGNKRPVVVKAAETGGKRPVK